MEKLSYFGISAPGAPKCGPHVFAGLETPNSRNPDGWIPEIVKHVRIWFFRVSAPGKPRCETSYRCTSRNPDGVKPQKVEGHVLIKAFLVMTNYWFPSDFGTSRDKREKEIHVSRFPESRKLTSTSLIRPMVIAIDHIGTDKGWQGLYQVP